MCASYSGGSLGQQWCPSHFHHVVSGPVNPGNGRNNHLSSRRGLKMPLLSSRQAAFCPALREKRGLRFLVYIQEGLNPNDSLETVLPQRRGWGGKTVLTHLGEQLFIMSPFAFFHQSSDIATSSGDESHTVIITMEQACSPDLTQFLLTSMNIIQDFILKNVVNLTFSCLWPLPLLGPRPVTPKPTYARSPNHTCTCVIQVQSAWGAQSTFFLFFLESSS